MARYTLYQTGPDNRSTYAECWGQASTSRGREIASASTLIGLLDAADDMGHDNWWIRGPGGKCVAGSRKDYYALPSVRQELARLRAPGRV